MTPETSTATASASASASAPKKKYTIVSSAGAFRPSSQWSTLDVTSEPLSQAPPSVSLSADAAAADEEDVDDIFGSDGEEEEQPRVAATVAPTTTTTEEDAEEEEEEEEAEVESAAKPDAVAARPSLSLRRVSVRQHVDKVGAVFTDKYLRWLTLFDDELQLLFAQALTSTCYKSRGEVLQTVTKSAKLHDLATTCTEMLDVFSDDLPLQSMSQIARFFELSFPDSVLNPTIAAICGSKTIRQCLKGALRAFFVVACIAYLADKDLLPTEENGGGGEGDDDDDDDDSGFVFSVALCFEDAGGSNEIRMATDPLLRVAEPCVRGQGSSVKDSAFTKVFVAHLSGWAKLLQLCGFAGAQPGASDADLAVVNQTACTAACMGTHADQCPAFASIDRLLVAEFFTSPPPLAAPMPHQPSAFRIVGAAAPAAASSSSSSSSSAASAAAPSASKRPAAAPASASSTDPAAAAATEEEETTAAPAPKRSKRAAAMNPARAVEHLHAVFGVEPFRAFSAELMKQSIDDRAMDMTTRATTLAALECLFLSR